jgi:outer membrane protein assembly factor BamB
MRTACVIIFASMFVGNPLRADWPQFRGPNSAGVSDGPATPTEFSPGTNELWSVPLGSGHSSPCIVGDSIFLTTFDQDHKSLEVVCVARATGQTRWRREVPVGVVEEGHPSFNPASSTPASDGERVVAYFGSFGLICFDVSGVKLWELRMPLAKSYTGNATSPIIAGNRVILYRGTYDDHSLLALDKRSGKQLWKVILSEPITTAMACTSCPIVAGDKLIVHAASAVRAFDISDGQVVWEVSCFTTATSTPVLAGDEVVVATWNQTGEPALTPTFPIFEELIEANDKDNDRLIRRAELPRLMLFHRPDGAEAPRNGAPLQFSRVDNNEDGQIDAGEWQTLVQGREQRRMSYIPHGVLAIPIDSRGTLGREQIRRLSGKGIPEVPSPVYHDGYVYFVKNGGVFACLEVSTGKQVYRMRARGAPGTYYASPIIADGKLFVTSGEGQITVISLGPEPKFLASNDMGEPTYATPAIVDGTLYVRTHTRLSAFALDR